MDPAIVIPAVIGIAAAFVLIPTIIIAVTGTRRTATCPDSATIVQLRLDAGDEIKRMFTDSRPTVCDCSRWPENAGCSQRCLESYG